ncbi:fimbria/pilus outer membrane usher protein [Salmonella enterica]|nr:fimbria/pilus outer membrane usher protein [Salmonella enterica]EHE3387874.1 fimbria/pilus outer membrane usher protein [Salmonella enterica]
MGGATPAEGGADDFRDYGYLSPYRQNKITLDPSTLPPDTAILQTDPSVVPTEGAVVPTNFKTLVGGRDLIKLTGIPFGAVVTIAGQKDVTGIVGDEGNV